LQIPKLKCFILKSKILDASAFVYLKWILNNVSHIEKLKVYLDINLTYQEDSMKRNYLIDANFIRQHCMPDRSRNLIDFNFNIVSKCELLSNDIQTIENSFKIHNWKNVKCFFDPIMSYQHISSIGMIKPKLFDGIM